MPQVPGSTNHHRTNTAKFMMSAAGCLALVLLAGASGFTQKYEHYRSPVVGKAPLFIAKNSMTDNATTTSSGIAVNCDEHANEAPCYPGIKLVGGPFGSTIFNFVLPYVVTIGAAYSYRHDGVVIGSPLRRVLYYVGLFVLFKVWNGSKNHLQGEFDASDHVTLMLTNYAFILRETAYHHTEANFREAGWSLARRAWIVFAAAVCGLQVYEAYWTAKYFHTPLESFAGYLLGLVFMIGFWLVSTPSGYVSKFHCCSNMPEDDQGARHADSVKWAFSAHVYNEDRAQPLLAA